MAIGTKERPERLASDLNAKTVKGAGRKTGSAAGEPSGKGKAKKSMKVKIGGAVLLLLIAGAAAKFTVLAPSPASGAAAKPLPGPVIQMSEMTLNLTGGQYLRIKLALQTTKGTKPDLDTTMATQAVIDEYSNRTPAELTGDQARAKAKAALLAMLQKEYPKQIMGAIYTEFVMTS